MTIMPWFVSNQKLIFSWDALIVDSRQISERYSMAWTLCSSQSTNKKLTYHYTTTPLLWNYHPHTFQIKSSTLRCHAAPLPLWSAVSLIERQSECAARKAWADSRCPTCFTSTASRSVKPTFSTGKLKSTSKKLDHNPFVALGWFPLLTRSRSNAVESWGGDNTS